MIYEEAVLRFNNTRSTTKFKQKFGSICGFWFFLWKAENLSSGDNNFLLVMITVEWINLVYRATTHAMKSFWKGMNEFWLKEINVEDTHGPHYE